GSDSYPFFSQAGSNIGDLAGRRMYSLSWGMRSSAHLSETKRSTRLVSMAFSACGEAAILTRAVFQAFPTRRRGVPRPMQVPSAMSPGVRKRNTVRAGRGWTLDPVRKQSTHQGEGP